MSALHRTSMSRITRVFAVSLACAGLLSGGPAYARQAPAAPPKPADPQQKPADPKSGESGQPSATSGAPAPPAANAPYSYDPQGRRDPFISLLSRGSDPTSATSRPSGLPGMMIAEVAVKGIIRDRSGYIAMVTGTGTKTLVVRVGDRLMDGTVKAITADSVVFSEDVNDPLSMVKQKEVRKTVRPADGGR
jgi:Tfp pilus assembly protein PilP